MKNKKYNFTEENIRSLFKDVNSVHKLMVDGQVIYSNDERDLYYAKRITENELYHRAIMFNGLKSVKSIGTRGNIVYIENEGARKWKY